MPPGDTTRLDDRARSDLQAMTSEAAAALLGQTARLKHLVDSQIVGVARGDGVQVVIFVSPYHPWTVPNPDGAMEYIAEMLRRERERQRELSGQMPVARPDTRPDSQDRRLTPTEAAIMRAATTTPTPVKVLARKARCRLNSNFRAAIARLVRAHKLVRTADGVALPSA